MRPVAIFVLVAACGRIDFAPLPPDAPAADPDDGNQSGSRLKIVWDQFEDGTRLYAGLYDSLRRESCTFLPWLDGNTYCTPDVEPAFYTDAGCTAAIGSSFVGECTMPSYVVDTDACAMAAHMFEVGTASAASMWYERIVNQCQGPFAVGNTSLIDLGAEVPVSDLAPTTITPNPTGGRLATNYYTSPDGLRLQASIRDSVLGGDCQPRDDGVCVPTTMNTTSVAADALCTVPLGVGEAGCAAPPITESRIASGDHYYRTGALANPPLWVWAPSTMTCTGIAAFPGESYYDVGPEFTLAPISTSIDAAPGHRIQLVHYTDGVARLATSYAYDTLLGVQCSPLMSTNGTLRCIPTYSASTGIIGAFSDASCTSAIDVIETLGPAIAQGYAFKAVGTACAPIYEVHAVGPPITTPIFLGVGTCQPTPPGYSINAAGAIVDPSMLSAVSVITDP